MTFILLFCFIVFNSSSCKENNRTENNTNSIFKDFYEGKSKFGDSLVNHFPAELNDSVISFSTSHRNIPEKIQYLTLLKKMSLSEKKIIQNLVATPDSCIIRIYFNRNTYGFRKKGLGECDSYIPVPHFGLISDEKEKPHDVKYYVLEKNNRAQKNHELYLRFYLPPEWKNGMTKGIGVSEKQNLIFYWTVLW